MTAEIHKRDIGTVLKVTVSNKDDVIVDLSSATNLYILFEKPDHSSLTKDAVFTTDGTDGIIQYTVIDGDLDLVGDWKIQAKAVFSSGTWYSNLDTFTVKRNAGNDQ